MANHIITRAVLFADVANSTYIYDMLGDKRGQGFIASCLSLLADIVKRHGGEVIKTIGDEIMCIFPVAGSAVEAGIEMHKGMDRVTFSETRLESPNLYVAAHYGPVIMKGRDVFGDTVNIAARVIKLAKQRQILITEEMAGYLPSERTSSVRFFDRTNLKGKAGEFNVYEVIWEEEDITMMIASDACNEVMRSGECILELTFQNTTVTMDQNRPRLSLGRQPHNDIVVSSGPVSRSHASIELRRGKFYLIDHSSNGSYILAGSGEPLLIKKEEAQLMDSGSIFLGRPGPVDALEAIRFRVRYT